MTCETRCRSLVGLHSQQMCTQSYPILSMMEHDAKVPFRWMNRLDECVRSRVRLLPDGHSGKLFEFLLTISRKSSGVIVSKITLKYIRKNISGNKTCLQCILCVALSVRIPGFQSRHQFISLFWLPNQVSRPFCFENHVSIEKKETGIGQAQSRVANKIMFIH